MQRCEAIQPLRWDAVDFENKQIHIRQAYKRKEDKVKELPKGKVQEYVPLAPKLAEYLAERRKKSSSRFVAPDRNGKMLSHGVWYHAVKRFCKEAGVTVVSPHGLRHSCTELWVQAGANVEDIRRLLNHKSASTTMTYIHRSDERLHEIATRIGSTATATPPPTETPKIRTLRLIKS
ncbi:MAG: tyrosine-type recombinase/integrase [Oligoflexales bacterium]